MVEQVLSIYAIILSIIALMVCMFFYVDNPRRDFECAIVYLLCTLLNNYYWGVYTILMGDNPNVSSIMAYFGCNLGYLPLFLLLINRIKVGRIKYFSFLSLIPIPVNICQFFLYIQFGGLFNNIWEVFFSTLISCMCINIILHWFKNRKNGVQPPYESIAVLALVAVEYVMWTASCFDWPDTWADPYTYSCLLEALLFVAIPFAAAMECGGFGKKGGYTAISHLARFIRPFYIGVVITCCVGGYVFAAWMRDTISQNLETGSDSDPYVIVSVTLFILTIILVVFSMTIIVIVRLAKKAAESDELRKAKDIADHSNAAKSDFLANMSHEIRTPINAVLGMNEMILRESLSSRDYLPSDRELIRKSFAEICNFAGNIESAGTNLLSIINDILDFSKIEAGKLEIVEGRYKLSSVLNDLCNMISFKAKEKGLKFKVDVDPAIPDDLYGDEVRFRQVITNILNNAVKYTHEGSVHMSVEKKDAGQMKDGRAVYLVIKVKDTGIGIKEEDIDRLFSKFERMDLGKNSTVEGTGLGLAITKSLLTMMGGSIEVDSEYGRGSQFTVILPQAVMSDEPVGDFKTKYEKSMLERKAYTESFRAPDAYILVVDDTSMNLTVIKGLLKNTDINIETAGGGIEAVNMATKLKYDLILMDQRMPGMDGTQAMHRILEFQDGPNIDTPFICLTADAVSGAKERYMQEGFTDYLTKPIDYEALERMLVKYLPKEKILPGKINTEQQAFADSPDMSSILEAAGVDTKAGLLYSRNSEEFYRSVLEEFLNNSREKEKGLEKYLEQKNWKDYSILVHALKSTSKMIGAVELSSMAADLEKASDAADEETVVKGHPAMMKEFIKLTDAIKEATGYEPPEADEDTAKEEDDEILEFLPQ